ncbi:MAG TPA: hypothetical protein VK533_05340 [Sphingomonas sp.]|uniref:hypothetical protein n=1 Tax=Sphingomonas sp. TaxID=28214 RepID=UPI002BD5DE88|nr:hypothetical protein [Sphingomonas sp.]HMI18949.1 hypothetical protein [Sphingomonas sp.]
MNRFKHAFGIGCVGLALSASLLAAAPKADIRSTAPDIELIVPADSPVRLRSSANGQARFLGQFVLSGRFTYGCTDDCQKPYRQQDMVLYLFPDDATVARLPHWRGFRRPDTIEIENSSKFATVAISRRTMRALEYGKLTQVSGYTSIVVDNFFTSVECDDSYASARFRAFATGAPDRTVKRTGGPGCG